MDTNKGADPPTEFELAMALEFIECGLRTSHANFRKECLVKLKWLFERIRRSHEKDIFLVEKGKAPKRDLDMVSDYVSRMVRSLYD